MKYFRVRQDERYLRTPVISNIGNIITRRKDVSIKNASKIKNVNVAFSNVQHPVDFIDILDKQLFLISNDIKKVFSMYEPSMIFKEVCILNNATDEYGRYALPLFKEIDCLSREHSIISPDRSYVKKIVLSHTSEKPSIFKVGGLMTDIVVVRLDVAESLLRRGIRKFTLEELEMEEGSVK